MMARYSGKCSDCGLPINAGEPINWDRGSRKAAHQTCPEVALVGPDQAELMPRIESARVVESAPAALSPRATVAVGELAVAVEGMTRAQIERLAIMLVEIASRKSY